MLSNLLPGLRDLRTPLAVGYLWLAAAWLAFGDKLPEPERAVGLLASVYRATTAVGATAALAAVTFIAYVLGTLLAPLGRPLEIVAGVGILLLNKVRSWKETWEFIILPHEQTEDWRTSAEKSLERFATEETQAIFNKYPIDMIWEKFYRGDLELKAPLTGNQYRDLFGQVREYIRYILRENLDGIVTQLQVYDKQELYQTYGRNKSEFQFRSGISTPILAIIIVLAIRWNFLSLLGLIAPLALQWQGFSKREEAELAAYQPVTERIIEAPAIKNLKASLDEMAAESEARGQGGNTLTPESRSQ